MSLESVLRAGLAEELYPEALGREEAWLRERLARHGVEHSLHEQPLSDGRWLRIEERRTGDGGAIVIGVDITELKTTAVALSHARDQADTANRAKSDFLANMSHEIRTPLNGVIGLVSVLATTALDSKQQQLVKVIDGAASSLQRLLGDLLDLASIATRGATIEIAPFDLGDAIRAVRELFAARAQEKDLEFELRIDPALERQVQGDAVRLQQILGNLVSNAVKFTEGGTVTIVAEPATDGSGRVCFEVQDTGIGFDEETRSRLFRRFQQADGSITRRFGGTGLGLAIARELAEAMGGTLEAESQPGRGSRFILQLPFSMVSNSPSVAA